MNVEDKDIIKKLFEEKFKNFEANPPGWNEFEPKFKKHKFLKRVKHYGVGIATISAIITAIVFFTHKDNIEQKHISSINTNHPRISNKENIKTDKKTLPQKTKTVLPQPVNKLASQHNQNEKLHEHNKDNTLKINKNQALVDSSQHIQNNVNQNPNVVISNQNEKNHFSIELLSQETQCAPANFKFKIQKKNVKSVIMFIDNKKIDASETETVNIDLSEPGNFEIHAQVTFDDNTTKTFTPNLSVTVLSKPELKIKETDNSIVVIKSKKTDNIIWKIDGREFSDITKLDFSTLEYGNHNITIIESNNYCSDTINKVLTIKEPIIPHMPNAFTPNNDGINDVFKPVFNIKPETYKFIIYDKFGKVLFVSTNPDRGWDGKNAAAGLYVWKLVYKDSNGKMIEKNGNVTLIKN
jgi:gliding motility-associated-like protein